MAIFDNTTDPRDHTDDVPEADRVEQDRDLLPDEEESEDELDVDPLAADPADRLEQATEVPDDDSDAYERP